MASSILESSSCSKLGEGFIKCTSPNGMPRIGIVINNREFFLHPEQYLQPDGSVGISPMNVGAYVPCLPLLPFSPFSFPLTIFHTISFSLFLYSSRFWHISLLTPFSLLHSGVSIILGDVFMRNYYSVFDMDDSNNWYIQIANPTDLAELVSASVFSRFSLFFSFALSFHFVPSCFFLTLTLLFAPGTDSNRSCNHCGCHHSPICRCIRTCVVQTPASITCETSSCSCDSCRQRSNSFCWG